MKKLKGMLAIASVASMLGLASAGVKVADSAKLNREKVLGMGKKARQAFHSRKLSGKWNTSKYMPHQGKQECARRVRNGDIYLCNSHGGTLVR